MRLTIVGGGGFRVPRIYRTLLAPDPDPLVDDVVLFDPDPGRLGVIRSVLGQIPAQCVRRPTLTTTTVLEEALEGSDFVFAAVRVGGLEGRVRDERVALDRGILGQETTGPGGIAFGLRTIPAMVRLAERVRELSPRAYLVNFTNPAGMITEALLPVLGDRVIGVCDTPEGLTRRLASALELDVGAVTVDYVGLNHLGWVRRVVAAGEDRLPSLLDDQRRLARLEEASLFGGDWLRAMGWIPNEYLYYYYRAREAVRAIAAQAATRGTFLLHQQAAFYAAAARDPSRALELWERAQDERRALYMAEARPGRPRTSPAEGGNGYERAALRVVRALSGREPATLVVNVRNRGALPGLPASAVVEVPARLDATGVEPWPAAPLDLHQLGLMQQVKAVERWTIEAAITGSRTAALRAFSLHPLVDSVQVGRELLDGYVAAIPEVARVLGSAPGP